MKTEQEIMEMFDKLLKDYEIVITDKFTNSEPIEVIKSFISQIITLVQKREREDFNSILDSDSCECDNCNRTRHYFRNPNKELLRYKNKLDAELKKEREEILENLKDAVKHTDPVELKTFLYTDQIINLINKQNEK